MSSAREAEIFSGSTKTPCDGRRWWRLVLWDIASEYTESVAKSQREVFFFFFNEFRNFGSGEREWLVGVYIGIF